MLDEAIDRDPRYAPALAYAATLRGAAAIWAYTDAPDEMAKAALDLARRALRADDNDAEVVARAARTIEGCGDAVTALALAERAIALNPGSAEAWMHSGWINVYAGHQKVGLVHLETALRLDPRSGQRWEILTGLGWSLLFLRCFQDAIPLLKEVGEIRPGFEGPAVALAASYGHLGRLGEAKSVLTAVRPDTSEAMFGFFRDPEQQDIIRSGLRLAGAEV